MKINKKHKSIILAAITLVSIIAAVFVTNQKASIEKTDVVQGKFLKDLQGNIDNVASFILRTGGKTVKVVLDGDKWIIPEKFSYPVEVQKIRSMVESAASYDIIEKKTDKAERLKNLGLENPDNDEIKSIRVTLMDKAETKIFADFIRGDQRKSGNIENVDTVYVRNADDNQTWLVKNAIDAQMNFHVLLSQSSYAIIGDRIQKATFTRTGNSFELSRGDVKQDFKIAGSVKELKDPVGLNNMATMLEGAVIIGDVMPVQYKEFGKNSVTATFHTFDGLDVVVQTLLEDKQYWIKISASGVDDKTKKEANLINSVAKDWAYRVIDKTGMLITAKVEDLVKETDERKNTAR